MLAEAYVQTTNAQTLNPINLQMMPQIFQQLFPQYIFILILSFIS